jgi:putative SOS response-associated peptidase YedK
MCASFLLRQADARAIAELMGVRLDPAGERDWEKLTDQVLRPHQRAMVLVREAGQTQLRSMNFSLVPRWSKERRPKFATHNARLESVAEKPTWRDAFQKRPCVVPLSEFYEPIYEGEWAGHMVAFSRDEAQILLAAGLWEEWVDTATGEVMQSFAILTTEPQPSVLRIGHDRSPVFLGIEKARQWLALGESAEGRGLKAAQRIAQLKAGEEYYEFTVRSQRLMKSAKAQRTR